MAENREAKLVWKPIAALYFSLFFLLVSILFGEIILFGADSDKTLSNWILSSVYFFPALFGTIYGVRTRVEATENGMRWRDWRGVWRASSWEEIGDFYKRASKSESGSTHSVETAQGNLAFGLERDGKLIAERIAARSINALMHEWEVKGERLCDPWPRRFEFWQEERESAAKIALATLLAVFGLTAALLWFRLPPRAELAPGVWFLAYVGPILLLPVLPFLIWIFLFVAAKQARPFRGQSVQISPTGIVFNGANRIEANWSQIEGVHWLRRGKVRFLELQTRGGAIEIPTFIFGSRALWRILERFSGITLVKAQGEEELALVAVQIAPDETLVFTFNNLGVQAMSWLFVPMGVAMFFTPFLLRLADPQTPPRDEAGFFLFGIVLFLLSLGWMWFLRVARLRLTRDALEWRAPFFHRTVPWQDIERLGSTPSNLDWISIDGKKLNLSYLWIPIAQRSRLHAEIEKRAFNAKGRWE